MTNERRWQEKAAAIGIEGAGQSVRAEGRPSDAFVNEAAPEWMRRRLDKAVSDDAPPLARELDMLGEEIHSLRHLQHILVERIGCVFVPLVEGDYQAEGAPSAGAQGRSEVVGRMFKLRAQVIEMRADLQRVIDRLEC